MYSSKVYSKVCGLPKVKLLILLIEAYRCCVCVLSPGGHQGLYRAPGPTGSPARKKELEKVACCHCCSPAGVKLYFFKYIIAVCILWPAVVFKIGASVKRVRIPLASFVLHVDIPLVFYVQ